MAWPDKPPAQATCPQCGKRIDSKTRAGSLTSYLFQNLSCSCGSGDDREKSRQPILQRGDSKDFCPKCGLRNSGVVRAGSITGFLFQDIRCKCPPEEAFRSGSMADKLRRLREADSGETFSRDAGNEVPISSSRSSSSSSSSSVPSAEPDSQFQSRAIGLARDAIIGGAYRIVEMIGRGGMGEVYLAEHLTLNKRCALKVIPPEQVTEMGWLRFQAEAKAVARLDHINLVKVSDLGIHDDCLPYYAMEYVPGRTMADLVADQGPMPINTALDIFEQVCDGLDYSHRNGIVHRDLKPANIILTKGAGGKISVKVLDFGLAKLTKQDRNAQSLTTVGEVFGSPFYMSPEQCEGGRIDNRSDIYSLGCTLFECLVGRPPFDGKISAAIIRSQLLDEAPSLDSVVGPGVFPDSLEVVLAKILRKNPVERYQTMAELKGDLQRVARGEDVLPFYMSRSNQARGVNRNDNDAGETDESSRRGDTASSGTRRSANLSDKRKSQTLRYLAIAIAVCTALAVCAALSVGGGAIWNRTSSRPAKPVEAKGATDEPIFDPFPNLETQSAGAPAHETDKRGNAFGGAKPPEKRTDASYK